MFNYLAAFYFFFLSSFEYLVFSVDLPKKYDEYLGSWNENIALAKDYLREAERSLKNGDALDACFNQKKASNYGLIATKARIKAAQLQGELSLIPNLESGLKRWKAFGDFCS